MGWSMFIKPSRKLVEEDVQQIIDKMPPKFGASSYRHSFGFALIADISDIEDSNSFLEFSNGELYTIYSNRAKEFSDCIMNILKEMDVINTNDSRSLMRGGRPNEIKFSIMNPV